MVSGPAEKYMFKRNAMFASQSIDLEVIATAFFAIS